MHNPGASRRGNVKPYFVVFASEAKQSILSLLGEMDCFAGARNDGFATDRDVAV